MALIVGTWWWGTKYGLHYVTRLKSAVHRHLAEPYRWQLWQPGPSDKLLRGGCLVRLRMFSTEWQHDHGIERGDRVVCLDLDLVVTGKLAPLFDAADEFMILRGANAANPCPYNGSVMMLRGGAHPEVWDEFTIERAYAAPHYEFPDDQGWIWHKIPSAAGWQCGPASGIYAFKKPGWPKGDALPSDARIVAFPGSRDPSQFEHLPWVREHWR